VHICCAYAYVCTCLHNVHVHDIALSTCIRRIQNLLPVDVYACMHVCVYVRVYVCVYACMHACMYACKNACIMCLCVCMRE